MPEGSVQRDQVAAVHTTDVLVLGAGSAGCVIAARLSEDAGTQVALIEAGPAAWRDPWIRIPAGFARLYASGKYDWRFHTEPEPGLDGRSIHWPRGKVVGGSGAVNGLVFLRGSPRDYDRWSQSGARGWGYDDCLPFFKRLETWSGEPSEERGTDGPIHTSEARHTSPGAQAFIDAALAMGHKRVRDFNGAWHEGVGPMPLNIKRGVRSHSGDMFLKPVLGRPNLRVMPERAIQRLLFEGARCTGALVKGPQGLERWEARREVVLSAGAIGTPHVLMLSGIGDGAHLQEMGIEARLHAPGVGQNLQDHFLQRMRYRVKPCGTVNEMMRSPLGKLRMAARYAFDRRGPMSIGAAEANLFARVLPGAEEPDMQYLFVNFTVTTYEQGPDPWPGFMFSACQCRPDSRGTITLRSPSPDDKPVIRANYLEAPHDQRLMVEGVKYARRLAAQRPIADLIEEELTPGGKVATDDEILAHIRRDGGTVYHPCGTARMGEDSLAPVDSQLRLKGVTGLRVADASVMPLVPSSNIQPAALMIGGKGGGDDPGGVGGGAAPPESPRQRVLPLCTPRQRPKGLESVRQAVRTGARFCAMQRVMFQEPTEDRSQAALTGRSSARPLVVFVGGAGDRALRKVGRVASRVTAMPDAATRDLHYLHHDQESRILALVEAQPAGAEVRLIGHSWGGNAAARIAAVLGARDRPVDLLLTVDPVGRRISPAFLRQVKAGARRWINARAADGSLHPSNFVAAIGGPYGHAPRGHADFHLDLPHPHAAFDRMMECRGPDGLSLLDLALGRAAGG